jgi:hypothetical protein
MDSYEIDDRLITSDAIEFQNKLFEIKEDFYKNAMNAPDSLKQDLKIMDILREDLYDIANSFDHYIDTNDFIIPSTNVLALYKLYSGKNKDDIIQYSKMQQKHINQFIIEVKSAIDSYKNIDEFLKKYYINQVFRIYIFNLNAPPEKVDTEEGEQN